MTESYEDEPLPHPAESSDCCGECGALIDSQWQIERPGADMCRACSLEYSA